MSFYAPSFLKMLCPALLLFAGSLFSQDDIFQEKMQWADVAPVVLPANYDRFAGADVVILDDNTEFNFFPGQISFAGYTGKVTRNILVKLNTEKGLEQFKTLRLPESFDEAYEAHLYKQGRKTRIASPYIRLYKVEEIMARKFAQNKWHDVQVSDRYTPIRWIGSDGGFIDEDLANYHFHDLQVGDVVQVYYEALFQANYGNNLFYLTSRWPRLSCEYTFTYSLQKEFLGNTCLFPMMIDPSAIKRSVVREKDGSEMHTDHIELSNLAGVNYPANSFVGRTQPHVCMNPGNYEVSTSYFGRGKRRTRTLILPSFHNFEWVRVADTSNHYYRVYDRHFESLRKFVSTLPRMGNDSMNLVFFRALCDTFNNFRYLSMNDLYYNKRDWYDVSDGAHLLKRRLVGVTWPLYRDILADANVFYYIADIQDKRYGDHSSVFRANHVYERALIAIPVKGSYIYFMPRYEGLKYFMNELPFYYEDALGVLMPRNFQKGAVYDRKDFFKFIRTGKGTYSDNSRTENTTVHISPDSLKADLTIKESLAGQFSTILRHLYLNEYIDSTIAPYYFKRCTDKPKTHDRRIKLSSRMTEYPFRHSFNCSEKAELQSGSRIDLTDWFSFLLSGKIITEPPNCDYYFDFQFSDSYNFLLNFDVPVELLNAPDFAKHISNEQFELESGIEATSDTTWLLKVNLAVKQSMLHYQEAGLLMELVKALDEINHFQLEMRKK